jgi:hypothetical protein
MIFYIEIRRKLMKKILFFILLTHTIFADVTTITSSNTVSGSVAQGEINYYKISASAGDTVTTLLNGLSDDADLHMRIGAQPTGGVYDCKSTNGGTNPDSCSVTLSSDADVYIRIYGYRTATYQVTATIEHSQGENILNVSDNVAKGETKFYTVNALAGQSVNSILEGLSDDADLYMRIGAQPTGSTYDCKSTNGGVNNDSCSVTLTQNATVHIAVYGYRATPYTLLAQLSGENIPTLTSGQTLSDSVERNAIKYYKINALFGDNVTATISNLTADADIFIKKGNKPTTSSYDCKSTNGGTTSDSCTINVLDDMEVYIGVSGFRAAEYSLMVTSASIQIPANPEIPTILEDAEGGTLNPNWITARGDKPGYIFPTPDIPGAPDGEGVMVHHADGSGNSAYRYELPIENTSQRILSMDMGGLPDHLFEGWSESYRGYIPHNGVGVVVETKLGMRIMTWDSWYTHQGYEPRKHDNGHNVFLNYPSPVEMVRGWYAPIDTWTHFEVNLDTELARLEPENRIYKIVQFFTTGGYLDNITLSAAPQ